MGGKVGAALIILECNMTKEVTARRAVHTVRLRHGDCVEVMKSLPESSVGAVVCDPPYG